MSKVIKFPPEDILNEFSVNKDFEYVILWMLHNNDHCKWADFKAHPLEISQASLSKYLKLMIANGQIEKERKGEYKITPEGRKHYIELQVKESMEEKLVYPPDIITRKRNYDHVILWMLYNNTMCKWSDFMNEPLSINNSSLSKNLGFLKTSGFIEHDSGSKEYRITKKGEAKYFRVLKQYDLDRQSILEEESKRIEVITDKVSNFFNEYEIESDEIKYRFLNIVLRLDYSQIENTLANENELNKIILFLCLNHPDQYPDYISTKDFSQRYDIKPTTLEFFIEKIVKERGYQIRFFELEAGDDIVYYIQAEEKMEKLLSVIVEDYIRKFTYLNKLQKKEVVENREINDLLDQITDEICINVFHEHLKPTIRRFLPEFIEHLAYKFESEKSLISQDDKTKGVVYQKFQNVFEVIQSFGTSEAATSANMPIDNESYYFLHNRIFDTLDIIYLSKIDFIRMPKFRKAYFANNLDFLTFIEQKLAKGSLKKANELINENIKHLSDIELLILRDLFYTYHGEMEESLKLTETLIEKFPNEYVGYLFQSITYFLMGRFRDAMKIADVGLKKSTNPLLIAQKIQVLINFNHDKAVEVLNDYLGDFPDNFALKRTQFLCDMTDKECCMKSVEIPLGLINDLIESRLSDVELAIMKAILFIVTHKHKEAKNWIKQTVIPNVVEANPRTDMPFFLVLAFSYLARGKFHKALDIVKKVNFHFPNHPLSHIITGLVHGFNLVYKFDSEIASRDLFRDGFQKAKAIEPSKKKLSRFYQLEGYILSETDGFDEAIKTIDKAIELSPEHFDIYNTKSHIYLAKEDKQNEAMEFFDEMLAKFPHEEKDILQMKSFSYFTMGDTKGGIESLRQSLKKYPDSIGMLNNLAIFLSYKGQFEEAVETIERAIEIDPKEANLVDTYGEVLMLAKEYDAATTKFVQALEMNPTAWFGFHTAIKLAKCYKALGNEEKAKEFFEKAEVLTEKIIPGKQKLYLDKLEEAIEDLEKVPIT